jgi:hypothetical protein
VDLNHSKKSRASFGDAPAAEFENQQEQASAAAQVSIVVGPFHEISN